jgi:hypothetical protein
MLYILFSTLLMYLLVYFSTFNYIFLVILGFELALARQELYHLSHVPNPLLLYFSDGVSHF